MKKPFTTTLFTSLLALFLILCTQTKSMAECHAMFGYSQSPNSLLVTFHDSSTSSFEIVTWSWTFGDNHTSDGHNPTHTYAQAGTYEVCLTIHDNHDCNSTVCHNVVVVAIPPGDCMALFTWVQNAGTQTVHFTDGSTSSHVITTWHWEFGDGTTSNDHSPSHYFTVGTHEVCLTIHDNSDCNSTFCTVITVVPENSGDCEALFEYSQTPNTLAIVFSDQSSSSHEITSWAWNFGDGHDSSQHNPTHTYSQPGTYQVCLTIHDNTGCTNTYCHEVIVAPVAPGDCMALFTWIQNAGTQTVHFTDASTSSHDITSWHWEFGDGTSSNDHSPSHYFPVGTYEVCLTIHDNTDCNDTYCTEITVTPENSGDCNAGFAWAQVPGTTQVHFESTSTSGHDITSYMWSFGDNHNGDGQNPYHTYENPGTYVVCLTIHDNSGCTDTYCDSIQVLPLVQGDCMALFTWYQMEGTNTIHFIDSSSSSHDITSWHWDFGDGHTSNDHNITHTYGEAGTYEVCLTIHDNTGCSDTYCTSVTVTPIEAGDCMASFEYSQGENSLDIHFVNTSTSEHEIISRFWTFGDGNSGDGNDPHHVYFHAGTYLVCLTIHDNSGCESTHCDSITVNPVAEGNCEAFFGWFQGENSQTIHFIDSSFSSHNITSWHWDFGDGHAANDHNITHTYSEPGTYEVCLTIHDNHECSDTYCTEVTVLPVNGGACHALFSFQHEGGSLVVHFTNASTSPNTIISYLWTFGDGTVSDNPNPTHTYQTPGTYEVCLTIHDNEGCTDLYCHSVTVGSNNSECHAAFSTDVDTSGLVVTFTNMSTNTTPNTTYLWEFGDGTSSTEQNPVHTYSHTDNYTVCLFITDTTTNCENHVCHIVNAHPVGGIHQSGLYADEHNFSLTKEKQNPAMEHFISIYPNPTSITSTIEYDLSEGAVVQIELCDLFGHRISEISKGNETPGIHRHSIEAGYLNPGIYIVKVIINQELIIRKITVTN